MGGENDSPPRELARFMREAAEAAVPQMNVWIIYRRDRFLRGSDNGPFLDQRYPAVRLTEPNEDYRHEHQNVRVENGVQFGDLPQFVDFNYTANVTQGQPRLAGGAGDGPAAPQGVRVEAATLTVDTTLMWQPNTEPDLAGYEIVYRDTNMPYWQHTIPVGNVTSFTVQGITKDNFIFGVRAVDQDGNRSVVTFPVPAPSRSAGRPVRRAPRVPFRENRAVARVLAIFGPTASGKTAVAEEVARRIPAELVSADAMQVYRGLPILTNQSEHPARLVGYLGLDEEGSVAEYQRLAHEAIDEILAAGRTPVVVGGTGLYLRAALADLELPPPPPPGTRDRLERLYDEEGAEQAHALLAERDPEAAAAVHPNDRRRVVRALELAEAGSSLRPGKDTLWSGETRHPTRVFGLEVPPEELARRIEARTHEMFERGVEEEVARALSRPMSATASTIHGLQDISELPREEAIEALVARTRRYAAYQRKWMRRIPGLEVLDADGPPDEVAQEIVRKLGSVAPAR